MNICTPVSTDRAARFVAHGQVRVVTAPTVEPLTLEQAIAHLRENPDDVDLVDLQAKITEARAAVEDICGRALVPQLLELSVNGFPVHGYHVQELELPMPPVIAIDSITYLGADGADVVMNPAAYRVDTYAQPAVVFLPYGTWWPVAQQVRNSVRIRYLAGYDAPANSPDNNPLPPGILAAVKLMLGHLWERREATETASSSASLSREIPLGIDSLLGQHKTRMAMA